MTTTTPSKAFPKTPTTTTKIEVQVTKKCETKDTYMERTKHYTNQQDYHQGENIIKLRHQLWHPPLIRKDSWDTNNMHTCGKKNNRNGQI